MDTIRGFLTALFGPPETSKPFDAEAYHKPRPRRAAPAKKKTAARKTSRKKTSPKKR